MSWFTFKQHKAEKAKVKNYYQIMLQLQPNFPFGIWDNKSTCDRSGICAGICLANCGRNSKCFNKKAYPARVKRTNNLRKHPAKSLKQIDHEITLAEKRAAKKHMRLCVRPNCLSDVNYPESLFLNHPDAMFEDYTKFEDKLFANHPANYFLTYSYNEKTPKGLVHRIFSETRFNVSVIFDSKTLPKKYTIDDITYDVIDGDKHDLRFLDKPGCIVGLRFKQPILKSGFIRPKDFNKLVVKLKTGE